MLVITSDSLYAQCGAPPTSGSTTISTTTIVNSYYPGAANANAGSTSITVGSIDSRGSSTAIGANDMIVIMQMQGADITSTNSSAYGANGTTGSGYTSGGTLYAGYYEYATVSSVSGSTLTLTVGLSNNYKNRTFGANGIRTFQVIRVPRYYTLTVTSTGTITAPAWDGSTGGVVILDAANLLSLAGSINVAGLGFRGGGGKNLTGASNNDGNSSTSTATPSAGSANLLNTDYRFNSPITNAKNLAGAAKGEGIAGTPAYTYSTGATVSVTQAVEGYINGSMGRGAPGNAGGGGTDGQPLNQNQSNTGGGGGGNAGAGGQGGSGWPAGMGTNDVNQYPYGGYGGAAFTQGSLQRIIMGGGGGAGTANNGTSSNEYNTSGGPGGGIIIARALLYSGSGSVTADGANGPGVTSDPSLTDAAGGGGGGGTIILATYFSGTTGLGSITASAKGGVGGYMTTYYNHGPGGGGGGGYIYTNGTLSSTNVTGGANGLTRTGSTGGAINNPYGTTAGANGKVTTLSVAPLFYCGVLPITLKSFTASLNGSSVNLNWQIGNAVNLSYFEIEYSTDGVNFNKIGDHDYTNNVSSYNFIHGAPEAGKNYYRLRMVDMDGKFTYSNILVVNLDNNSENKLLIYPNPTSSNVTLQFLSNNKQQTQVLIFDNTGRRLISKNISVEKGNNYISITDTKNLADGIYLIELNIDSKLFVDKFIVRTH